jgi:hypothetical protein
MNIIKDATHVLENRIMRRVYGIWLFRRVRYSSFTKLCLVGLLAVAASPKISFIDIFRNLGNVQNLAFYLWDAMLKTELLVQLAVVAGIALLTLLVIDLGRSVGKLLSRSVVEDHRFHSR